MQIYEIFPSIFQRLAWVPLRLLFYFFCSLEIIGQENFKNLKSNIIIASGHSSELDSIIAIASLPFFSRYLPLFFVSREKDFYKHFGWKKIIYGGTFFKILGAYQVHVNLKNYEQSLCDHLVLLRHGKSVLIFPSGKRNTYGETPKARGGVSFLAKETNLPVIPMLIEGVEHMTLHDLLFHKRKIRVIFGKPLYVKDIFKDIKNPTINTGRNDYKTATAAIFKKIAQLSDL